MESLKNSTDLEEKTNSVQLKLVNKVKTEVFKFFIGRHYPVSKPNKDKPTQKNENHRLFSLINIDTKIINKMLTNKFKITEKKIIYHKKKFVAFQSRNARMLQHT